MQGEDEEGLATVGYEEDGIVWITVTPPTATATAEAALAEFAGTHADRPWTVRGRRDLVLDEAESLVDGEHMVVPVDRLSPGGAFWEPTAPGLRYGEEPWASLDPPEEDGPRDVPG